MKNAALAALLLSLGSAAHADLVVKQKVEGGGQSGEQIIRIRDHQARCDIGGAISVIVDRASGETTTLAHAQRGFLTLDAARSKALNERMQASRGSATPPQLIATGRKEKVGDHQCEIFTADLGNVKLSYWLAREYPNFAELNAQLDILDGAPGASAASGLAPRARDLPGFPLKIQMEMASQKVVIQTLSVTDEKVDPAIFSIPQGYKELPSTPPPAQP